MSDDREFNPSRVGAELAREVAGEVLAGHRRQLDRVRTIAAVASHPRIIDSVAFADLVLGELSRDQATRSAVRARAFGRVHYRMALECLMSGFTPAARQYISTAIRLTPHLAMRRRAWQCLWSAAPDPLGPSEIVPLAKALSAERIGWCITGSLALSFHAGRAVKTARDVDIDLATVADLEDATRIATRNGFAVVARREWTCGRDTMRVVMTRSSAGLLVEFAHLPNGPAGPIVNIPWHDTTAPVIALAELRSNYIRFMRHWNLQGAARWSSKHAVITIDALLGNPPTLVTTER